MLEWLHWQDCQIERGARAMNLIYYPSLLAASNLRSEKIKKAGQRKKKKKKKKTHCKLYNDSPPHSFIF